MKKLNILIVVATLLCTISAAHANISHSKVYTLKGDRLVGSLLRSTDATSSVPFSKRFKDLTSEQQNLVRAKFDNLGRNDTPPFPVSGLRAVYKPLIKANKTFGDNSALEVTAKITSQGFVNGITVHNNDNTKLVAYIERSLRYTKFDPASCNGVACDMDFPIEINFK